jgi:hypothetical protein
MFELVITSADRSGHAFLIKERGSKEVAASGPSLLSHRFSTYSLIVRTSGTA